MWMRPEFQATVRPLVTSHCYNVEPFQKDYAVQGTVDKTSIGVIKDAVQFYRSIGGHVSSVWLSAACPSETEHCMT